MKHLFDLSGIVAAYADVVRVEECPREKEEQRFAVVLRDGQRLLSPAYAASDFEGARGAFVSTWDAALASRSGDASGVVLQVKRLRPDAKVPVRSSDGASCFDVYAVEGGVIKPGQRALVKTGLQMAVPHGFEIQVRSRSGHAAKAGVFVLNSPGTVDSDYRGEVGVILQNSGTSDFPYAPGDRIAQIAVCAVEMCAAVEVQSLTETQRGAGGFGSTGK